MPIPKQLYDLAIEAIEPDKDGEPITWMWLWWKGQERAVTSLVKSADYCHANILLAYRDAVVWAAKHGPSDLADSIMQLDNIGYKKEVGHG